MQTLRIGTFNLFQFAEPPYSWYDKKNSFSKQQWLDKTAWIKNQIIDMNCDVIGFQEVFSKNALEKLTKELGFDYFVSVEDAKIDNKDPNIFISTTVALVSKYPILEIVEVPAATKSIVKHKLEDNFQFSRTPIKAIIELPDKQIITVYVNHLKSNRENELEYLFRKEHTLEEKILKTKDALEKNISKSLKQRLCEASSLFFDIKETNTPIIFMCDLNDKEFSLTIEALTNEAYHENTKENSYLLYDCYNLVDKKIHNPHPEQKKIQRTPTSYFQGKGSVLDYIFVSKEFVTNEKKTIGKITSYEIYNKHFHNNPHGSLLQSDHAQIVCNIELN